MSVCLHCPLINVPNGQLFGSYYAYDKSLVPNGNTEEIGSTPPGLPPRLL